MVARWIILELQGELHVPGSGEGSRVESADVDGCGSDSTIEDSSGFDIGSCSDGSVTISMKEVFFHMRSRISFIWVEFCVQRNLRR